MNSSHRIKNIYALAAGLLLASSASIAAEKSKADKPPPISGRDCVFFSTMLDWQALDPQNLVVWAPNKKTAYQVYVMMPLFDMNISSRLAFIDKDRDGMLCGFSTDEIAATEHSLPQHSSITAMKRLSEEDIAKLEEQYKVKLSGHGKKAKPKTPEGEAAK